MMKKIMIPIMFVAFLVAFYEQKKTSSNVYITVGAMAIFMYGMMQLSTKTPSKNQDKKEEYVE